MLTESDIINAFDNSEYLNLDLLIERPMHVYGHWIYKETARLFYRYFNTDSRTQLIREIDSSISFYQNRNVWILLDHNSEKLVGYTQTKLLKLSGSAALNVEILWRSIDIVRLSGMPIILMLSDLLPQTGLIVTDRFVGELEFIYWTRAVAAAINKGYFIYVGNPQVLDSLKEITDCDQLIDTDDEHWIYLNQIPGGMIVFSDSKLKATD